MPTDILQSAGVKYWAVVPAAGIGKRMGSAIPKQYLPLGDSTVIDLTLERLLSHAAIVGIIVAISPGDGWWGESDFAAHNRVKVVQGGSERCYSVLNALRVLQQEAQPHDRVLVHDAARPCVRHGDISRLIHKVGLSEDGGLLGIPVKDTMKRTNSHDVIQSTLDREGMWHAFTPQMFPLENLLQALQHALDKGEMVTDEASAMELAGYHPVMVEGGQDNIKITRPDDLALADYYLQQQKN